jgi:hypothetical protein
MKNLPIDKVKITGYTDKYVVWTCDRGKFKQFLVPKHPHTFFSISIASRGQVPQTARLFNCNTDTAHTGTPEIDHYLDEIKKIQLRESSAAKEAAEIAADPNLLKHLKTLFTS